MRHSSVPRLACHWHTGILALFLTAASPVLASCQAAFHAGFTAQQVSAGSRRETLRGFDMDATIRLGSRFGLIVGMEGLGHGEEATRTEFRYTALRTGLSLRLIRSHGVDLHAGAGLGFHSLKQDREDDGGGATAFLMTRLAFQPLPIVGVYLGGVLQSMGGFGHTIGGSSYGLMLGVQVRSDDW